MGCEAKALELHEQLFPRVHVVKTWRVDPIASALRSAYAAGAEQMRERAMDAIKDSKLAVWNFDTAHGCIDIIRALPLRADGGK